MSQKRMFNKKVLDTDSFLGMPLSSQALYFHLNLRADDDGFVSNPVKIKDYIGASDDDLKLLILKRFLIAFNDGVVVIKHWRMHNTIQKDRYTQTDYIEDLEMLGLKKNKSYTLDENQMVTKCIQNVSTDIDIGIDKDKEYIDISKDISLSTEVDEPLQPELPAVSCQDIVDLYHAICISYPKIRKITNARKKAIKARLREYSKDDIKAAFEKAEASSFMKGNNSRNWSASFDWMMDGNHLPKILEGNYDNKGKAPAPQKSNSFNNFTQRDYDYDAIERKLLGANRNG